MDGNTEDLVIEVETATPGTYVEVGGMDSYDLTPSRSRTTRRVFMGPARTNTGSVETTGSLSGIIDTEDAGQLRLLTLFRTNVQGKLRVKLDGANGFIIPIRVTQPGQRAAADGEFIEHAFEFAVDGAPTIVGTGPLPF